MDSEVKGLEFTNDELNRLVITGIGKTLASSSLSEEIVKNEINEIINIGFAGGSSEYKVGDIIIIEKSTFYDFDLTPLGYEKGQVPGYTKYLLANTELLQEVSRDLGITSYGTLYTSDHFVLNNFDKHSLFDMEGNSLALVAKKFGIPYVSIKIVSDVVDKHNVDEYVESELNVDLSNVINSIIEKLRLI
jgi:adenosylhomocysteine nucleosidase